jgi:hypothetical protein
VRRNLTRYLGDVSENNLRDLLRFATGAMNFSNRCPPPTVYDAHGKGNGIWVLEHEQERLPFGQTCFNELSLPDEPDFAVFRDTLTMAVQEGLAAGFQDE